MIIVDQKIELLHRWAGIIASLPDALEVAMLKSHRDNLWFERKKQLNAIQNIVDNYLKSSDIGTWIRAYPMTEKPKKIGLVMAGNIPLVGFHDLLSVIVSGHQPIIKVSEKDQYLLPAIIHLLKPHYWEKISGGKHKGPQFVEKLGKVDAIIATGSNLAGSYFEKYFSQYPHIIRKNRNSLAVLTGNETDAELAELTHDILDYYGLGCRSVSLVMIPSQELRHRLLATLEKHHEVMDNRRYANNFKYNYAIYTMNCEQFETNNMIIFKESDVLHSRIACLHYIQYESIREAHYYVQNRRDEIQCVISAIDEIGGMKSIDFGTSQKPTLWDYADDIDTRKFLANLK